MRANVRAGARARVRVRVHVARGSPGFIPTLSATRCSEHYYYYHDYYHHDYYCDYYHHHHQHHHYDSSSSYYYYYYSRTWLHPDAIGDTLQDEHDYYYRDYYCDYCHHHHHHHHYDDDDSYSYYYSRAWLHPDAIGDALQRILAERLEVGQVIVALLEEGLRVLAQVPGGKRRPDLLHPRAECGSQPGPRSAREVWWWGIPLNMTGLSDKIGNRGSHGSLEMGYLQSKLFGDHCVNQLVRPTRIPPRQSGGEGAV